MSQHLPDWTPTSCTLPTAEQPLRLAEFDELFARDLFVIERPSAELVVLWLDPTSEDTTRDLVKRENGCCSFFDFTVTSYADRVRLEVTVPPAQTEVLDGLVRRARAVTNRCHKANAMTSTHGAP